MCAFDEGIKASNNVKNSAGSGIAWAEFTKTTFSTCAWQWMYMT